VELLLLLLEVEHVTLVGLELPGVGYNLKRRAGALMSLSTLGSLCLDLLVIAGPQRLDLLIDTGPHCLDLLVNAGTQHLDLLVNASPHCLNLLIVVGLQCLKILVARPPAPQSPRHSRPPVP